MYTKLPAFVLGFHGCDQSLVDAVVNGRDVLRPSRNDYDWLGHGIYFWENNPGRAYEYAHMLRDHPKRGAGKVRKPAVLGAGRGQYRLARDEALGPVVARLHELDFVL